MRTAGEIADGVRRGRLAPADVAGEHLERIAALDGRIGAFQVVREAEVLAEARALGKRDDLAELPLAGVPIAVKDNLHLEGAPTRSGSTATPAVPAHADDELVRRVRAAGALLIGKTRVPELNLWPFTETRAYGITRNPWHLGHTPGGSTGGGAAAVAAGMVPLAFGSDGGGSIRIPASCCGLVGIKPGRGVVPQPLGTPDRAGLAERGPLATTVADLGLLLDVLAGTGTHTDVGAPAHPLRIAVSARSPVAGVRAGPEILAALAATAEALRAAGHRVEDAHPPYRPTDTAAFLARFWAEAATDAAALNAGALEPRTRGVVRAGRAVRTSRGGRNPGPAERVSSRFEAWFSAHDVLVTPTLAMPPLRVGTHADRGFLRTTAGLTAFMPYTPVWNLVGFPAMSVPAGRDRRGLPIGVQLVAPRGGEALLLAVARQLEQRRPWPRTVPL